MGAGPLSTAGLVTHLLSPAQRHPVPRQGKLSNATF